MSVKILAFVNMILLALSVLNGRMVGLQYIFTAQYDFTILFHLSINLSLFDHFDLHESVLES